MFVEVSAMSCRPFPMADPSLPCSLPPHSCVFIMKFNSVVSEFILNIIKSWENNWFCFRFRSSANKNILHIQWRYLLGNSLHLWYCVFPLFSIFSFIIKMPPPPSPTKYRINYLYSSIISCTNWLIPTKPIVKCLLKSFHSLRARHLILKTTMSSFYTLLRILYSTL